MQAEPDGCIDLWAREHGKDLADTTPVLTANKGWKNHGELEIGDCVFSPSGKPVRVLALSERFTNNKCYEIEFLDGAKITAGSGHLWRTFKKIRRRDGLARKIELQPVIMTTEQMFGCKGRIDVGRCLPLEYDKQNLPIDPYVFGAWVGDGTSDRASITGVDKELFSEIERRGYSVSPSSKIITYKIDGLKECLKQLGVIKNKHIPRIYMTASISQRLDLLRGLMDTDGCCDTRGTAMFSQKKEHIARSVYELAASLGMMPRFRIKRSKYNGKDYISYDVSFQAKKESNPFLIKRKADRAIKKSHYHNIRTVKKITPVSSVPTRCIQVEGNLYVVGKQLIPTHNSTVITIAKTIQDILNDPEITIGIFSHNTKIAKSFLRVIKFEFENNAVLKECFNNILWDNPSKESPKWSEDVGITVRRKGNPPECTVEASGLVDGMPTGRHYALRIYDDVVTSEAVATAEQMQKTIDAVDMSQNLGKVGGAVRFIGTRYKLGDAYEDLIKRGKYKPRIKPATDNGRVDGVPVMLTQEQWDDKLLDMSPAIISSQMLQNPLASDAVIFQPEWFQFYPAEKELPAFSAVYQSLDGAISQKETADYSCLITFGLFKEKEDSARQSIMVIDCVMERLTYPELRDTVIKQFQNKYGKNDCPVSGVIIENKASGQQLLQEFRRSRVTAIPFDPKRVDKIGRANMVSHIVRDGYLWIPESRKRKGYPMTWLSAWYEQMLYFPNVKHDDGVDATTQFLFMMNSIGQISGRKAPPKESFWKRQLKNSSVYG